MRLLSKLTRGDVSLAKGFWLFAVLGALGIILFAIISFVVELILALVAPQIAASALVITEIVEAVLVIAYLAIVPISVYRSGARFQGPRYWPVLSCVAVAAISIFLGGNLAINLYGMSIVAMDTDSYRVDYSRNAHTVVTGIKPDARFPYSGFWQDTCPLGGAGMLMTGGWYHLKRQYRIEHCSEQLCGLRGYSTLTGNPKFRIIDHDTIEFEASSASMETRVYHRCTS